MPLSTLRLEPRGSTKTELMLFGADSELLQSLERLSGDLPFISYAPGSGPQVVAKFGLDALWATPMIGAELFGAGPSFPLHEARVFETPVAQLRRGMPSEVCDLKPTSKVFRNSVESGSWRAYRNC